MKYIEKLKVQLRGLGIFYSDSILKAKLIAIALRCGLSIICILHFSASTWYFLFEAQTLKQHSESLVSVFSALLIFLWFLTLLFQCEQYAELLNELDSIIDKSKFIDGIHLKFIVRIQSISNPHNCFIVEKE